MLNTRLSLAAVLLLTGASFALPAAANSQSTPANTVAMSSSLDVFTPKASSKNIRLDYEVLDDALQGTVIRFGPSIRRYMGRPDPGIGTRIVRGHTSGYRLEGSRVSFSFFNKEYLAELTEYRRDLERIGTQIDIAHMPRDEQLAFWFNLHNVAMIEQISAEYPTRYPHEIKVGGVDLDDAKILNIKNVPLSLRDIREKIVFANWSNPNVIYGFFRGNIGSPALQNYAYTGINVKDLLTIQATEYVNSLRGFNLSSKNRKVSALYEEARPFFFTNWEADIQQHLLRYAREDVAEQIRDPRPMVVDKYDYVIADLMGGDRPRIATGRIQAQPGNLDTYPREILRLLRELESKTQVLRKRKLISTGTVTIEDVETIDVYVPDTTPSTEEDAPK